MLNNHRKVGCLMSIHNKDSKATLNFPKLRFAEYKCNLEVIKLKDISSYRRGKAVLKNVIDNDNGKHNCIHYADLSSSLKPISNKIFSKTNENNGVYTTGNELLINYGGYADNFSWVSIKESDIRVGREICIIKIPDNINSDYLSLILSSKKYLKKINGLTEGIVARQLPVNYILNIKFPITKNQVEQNKIVDFFVLLYKKIEVQNRILENNRSLFDFLINNTFKIFFKNNSKIPLNNLIKETSNRNKEDKISLVLSVNKTLGLVSQNENFKNRIIASVDKVNYKIVEKENFAYNPARINIGSIAMLRNFKLGLVSPMYITFKAKEDKALPLYLNYFFKTNFFNLEVQKRLEGSVRSSLKFNDLKDIEIPLLKLKDQENISILFEKIERKIKIDSLLEKQFKNIKTFLLNNMFS